MPERAINNHKLYDDLFVDAAVKDGVDWLRLKAQAMAESNLDPLAQSPAGAQGIARFMPATWREWGRSGNPFNPGDAIPAQARYLKYLLDTFYGDYALAFAAYNWGMGRVRRHVRKHGGLNRAVLPEETREYLARIERIHNRLQIKLYENHRPKGGFMPDGNNQATRPKFLLRSKTFWFNAIAGVFTLGLYFLGVPIPGELVTSVVGGSLGNIGLRMVTKDPVNLDPAAK